MAKIIVDSSDLLAVASDIEANCTALGYLDEEDFDEAEFYVPQLQNSASVLRGIIRNAEPVKG